MWGRNFSSGRHTSHPIGRTLTASGASSALIDR
jgi:hypothetical protein